MPLRSRASLILEKVFENAHPDLKYNYKILLLGGTGQGKTALLNFFANVQRATQSINGIESCKSFNKDSLENHVGGPMASKTSDALRYVFKIG